MIPSHHSFVFSTFRFSRASSRVEELTDHFRSAACPAHHRELARSLWGWWAAVRRRTRGACGRDSCADSIGKGFEKYPCFSLTSFLVFLVFLCFSLVCGIFTSQFIFGRIFLPTVFFRCMSGFPTTLSNFWSHVFCTASYLADGSFILRYQKRQRAL